MNLYIRRTRFVRFNFFGTLMVVSRLEIQEKIFSSCVFLYVKSRNVHQGAEEVEADETRSPYMLVHVSVKYIVLVIFSVLIISSSVERPKIESRFTMPEE